MKLIEKYLIKFKQIENQDCQKSPDKIDKNIIFEEKFSELVNSLSQYDLVYDEIKAQKPEIHSAIQQAIDEMDNAWLAENFTDFLKAVTTIETLYDKASQELRP